ncbi:MAG: hypothetical protein HY554_19445 [Elusimicrobia bacterium]|nr:hypothetical protein [Elusimicrobiota bacterium]
MSPALLAFVVLAAPAFAEPAGPLAESYRKASQGADASSRSVQRRHQPPPLRFKPRPPEPGPQPVDGVPAPPIPDTIEEPSRPAHRGPGDFRKLDGTLILWPVIPFVQAGDFQRFVSELGRSRDQARRELARDFGELLIPLAGSNADLDRVARALSRAIVTFDRLARERQDQAHDRIPLSFENLFRAEFDRLYLQSGLGHGPRRAAFAQAQASAPAKELLEVDLVLYGSYTVGQAGSVAATLTVENVKTGATRSFAAAAPVAKAMASLAYQVFDFLQSFEYADWVNPQPNLAWETPDAHAARGTSTQASIFCKAVGGRLPYTQELVLGAQAGRRPGGNGVRLDEGEVYVVADRKRQDVPHYYHAGNQSAGATGGPVRPGTAFGRAIGNIWCVKGGPPAFEIRAVESLYRLIRANPGSPARPALEYLLHQLDDFGAWPEYAASYPSRDAALADLRRLGYFVALP